MFRKLAAFSMFCALMVGGAGAVRAAENLKVVIPELAPWGYLDAEKKPAGLYVELTELVAKKADVPISITITPLPRGYAGLEDGSFDVLALMVTPKTTEIAEKVAKLVPFDNVVIGGKGTSFANLAALKGKAIANLRGMNYDQRFNDDPDIKKVETNSYEMNINMVTAGRADGMIGPQPGLLWHLKKMGVQAEFGTPLVLNTTWVYLHYSNKTKNPQIAAKLSAAAVALEAEKAFDPILAKYTR